MKERLLFSLTTLLFVCYGCSEQGGPELTATEAAAGNAVVLTANLDTLVEEPRNEEALISMTRIFGDLTTVANAEGAGVFEPVASRKAPLSTCVTEYGALIVYNDCSVSNGTIDGTILAFEDEIRFDLSISVEGAAEGSLEVLMEGSVEITESLLEGSLLYTTIIRGLEEFPDGLRLTLDAAYLGIELDRVKCPLAGTLQVEQRGPDANTGLKEAFFGPDCTDVTLAD
ncbi:MAG: hypothetical protein WBG86_14100 [Polyangiales bacterium]